MVKRSNPAATEVEMVERIRLLAAPPRGGGLVLGIGDDCAIYRPRGAAEDLLFTTDMLIEGVHFLPATHRPEDIGWKALARGPSDIAAMGGETRFFPVSPALAPPAAAHPGPHAAHRPEDIGWKALARGLSDIAAMGGEPRFCLVSLALARWAAGKWIDAFYRGL